MVLHGFVGFLLLLVVAAQAVPPPTQGQVNKCRVSAAIENRTIEQIYQAALREGNGSLVVYQAGSNRNQGGDMKQAFEQRFPGITVDIVVDYSIYHGPRIDVQLANRSLVPDVVQVQTLQDYPRWKREGHLLKYKPANYSKVYAGFRDPDGYYTALGVLLIGTVVNSQQVPNESQYPRTAADFLRPEFGGGRLVVIHPKMDDFILFYFKQIVDKYGMDYLARFAAQQPVMVCEGMPQFGAVGLFPSNLTASVGVAAFASFDFGNGSVPRFVLPEGNDPSIATYATYYSIFAAAKRPEAAKLYINWLLERESPTNQGNIWPVRTDMQPQQGFRQIWEYTNSNHAAFLAFMEDYEERERFGKQVDLFLGPVPNNCDLGPLQPGVYPQ